MGVVELGAGGASTEGTLEDTAAAGGGGADTLGGADAAGGGAEGVADTAAAEVALVGAGGGGCAARESPSARPPSPTSPPAARSGINKRGRDGADMDGAGSDDPPRADQAALMGPEGSSPMAVAKASAISRAERKRRSRFLANALENQASRPEGSSGRSCVTGL